MKVSIKQTQRLLPEISQPWTHSKHSKKVFVRIYDSEGAKALGHPLVVEKNCFYSVDLTTGEVVHTSINTQNNIVLLKPINNGEIFEPV